MNVEQLRQRVEEIEQTKDRYIFEMQIQWERQVGIFDGAISELRRLIEELSAESEDQPNGD